MNVRAPWIKSLGSVPAHLEYFQGSMYDKVAEISENYPDLIAYAFMGGKTKYKDFISKVDKCARALAAIGVKPGESVTICMADPLLCGRPEIPWETARSGTLHHG